MNGADKSMGSLFLQLPFALRRNVDSLVLSDQEKAVISQLALGKRMCAIFSFDMKRLFGGKKKGEKNKKKAFYTVRVLFFAILI